MGTPVEHCLQRFLRIPNFPIFLFSWQYNCCLKNLKNNIGNSECYRLLLTKHVLDSVLFHPPPVINGIKPATVEIKKKIDNQFVIKF